ncbi:MAG: hypothetical protein HC807_00890 [Gammaproteobacteria bacterium]|nr:hypothetical protein [Gammaproteobacteria bacterium]
MDDDRESMLHHDRQVIEREEPLQQQNGLAHTCIAQPHGLVEIEQREAIRRGQRIGYAHEPVPVRVRLHDRPHARFRRRARATARLLRKAVALNVAWIGRGMRSVRRAGDSNRDEGQP